MGSHITDASAASGITNNHSNTYSHSHKQNSGNNSGDSFFFPLRSGGNPIHSRLQRDSYQSQKPPVEMWEERGKSPPWLSHAP